MGRQFFCRSGWRLEGWRGGGMMWGGLKCRPFKLSSGCCPCALFGLACTVHTDTHQKGGHTAPETPPESEADAPVPASPWARIFARPAPSLHGVFHASLQGPVQVHRPTGVAKAALNLGVCKRQASLLYHDSSCYFPREQR